MTTGKTILILSLWFIFACFLSRVAAVMADETTSAVVWGGLLLLGMLAYWKTPRMRNGFILLALVPLALLLASYFFLSMVGK